MTKELSPDIEVEFDEANNTTFIRRGIGPQRQREILKLNSNETNQLFRAMIGRSLEELRAEASHV